MQIFPSTLYDRWFISFFFLPFVYNFICNLTGIQFSISIIVAVKLLRIKMDRVIVNLFYKVGTRITKALPWKNLRYVTTSLGIRDYTRNSNSLIDKSETMWSGSDVEFHNEIENRQ